MVYPGATHSRFEHSLGVADVATRIFDVVVREDNLRAVQDRLEVNRADIDYWRNVLRVAALCHDAGHLPFSHAAEAELLPSGWNHERITKTLIEDSPLADAIKAMSPPIRPEDVVKIAVSPASLSEAEAESMDDWTAIVSEIISGAVFGADRMDYLLRDSHHTGVAYGRFDHYRLIDTIRILPAPPMDRSESQVRELTLGVEEGGLQTAESLLLARYFMFKQVYFHHVRRSYDLHLLDFLKLWLPDGQFSTDVENHLSFSDPAVMAEILAASVDESHSAHDAANRFMTRRHHRRVYKPQPADRDLCSDPGKAVFLALADKFEQINVKHDVNYNNGVVGDFPVLIADGSVVSALSISEVLQQHMSLSLDTVYAAPEIVDDVRDYLKFNLHRILEDSSED